jgi:fatty acid desaturase
MSSPPEIGWRRGSAAASASSWRDRLSLIKVAIYFASILAAAGVLAVWHDWAVGVAVAVFLGIAYAHGLELQHEALHGILLATPAHNRILGSLLGLPMLTTFTETRAQHLHHHRYVGTPRDVYDRSCRDFSSLRALLVHVFSLDRLLDFPRTLLALWRGSYCGVLRERECRAARSEFVATALALAGLLALAAAFDPRVVVWGWVVPALVIGPVVHFFMTSAEHLGRPSTTMRLEENTRSYATTPLWTYLVHYDNYHVEHHRSPMLPFCRLPALHARRCAAGAESIGYRRAIGEVFGAIRLCMRSTR